MEDELTAFVRESNRIEGTSHEPTDQEIASHKQFLALDSISVGDLERLVDCCQPGAELRGYPGMDVRVGGYIAPKGGSDILEQLKVILSHAKYARDGVFGLTAQEIHVKYEMLHPFTDGNGRSGRALWLWQMGGRAPLGFPHEFYYQTLSL